MNYYNLHTHKCTAQKDRIELVNQYPWEFDETLTTYSIGIHPWYIDERRLLLDLKVIEEKLSLSSCLALGECGLDKRIDIPMQLQKTVFELQIDLAIKYQKPLILHLVAAYDELLEINKQKNINVPVILHGFSKNEKIAKQLLDEGFYLSFGKYLLRNPELKNTFIATPNNRIFLETDTIEESIESVYNKAAQYKEVSILEMQQIIEKNWRNVFLNHNF